MRFKEQIIGDVPVFVLTGSILGGKGSRNLRQRITEYVEKNDKEIILDMAGVNSINGEGQNMLIGNSKIVKEAGGRLAIINIDKIDSLLAVTKLVSHLEYFDSREEALSELGVTATQTDIF